MEKYSLFWEIMFLRFSKFFLDFSIQRRWGITRELAERQPYTPFSVAWIFVE